MIASVMIIRHHVGQAKAIVAELIDPKSGARGPVAMRRLLDRVQHYLNHRELVFALSTEYDDKQANAKSSVKAKNA